MATPSDSSKNVIVNILSATNSYGIQTDTGLLQRLVGNVRLQQGSTTMSCDSAYLNLVTNNMEAFGNVQIIQAGGTQVNSDYLRYRGNQKLAYLSGNVSLTDGKSNLWSENLTYDLNSKIGTYQDGGTLESETTTLSSKYGSYNTQTKEARFRGDVSVTDPKYDVTSEDLGYNTASKLVSFFGPSVVVNDQSELRTSSGTYDSKNEIAHFNTRSSMQQDAQYIEGDKLDYNRTSGFGQANGRVVVIDTLKKSTLWCGFATYNERSHQLFATQNPVLLSVNGQDSLYIAADTFYSAPEKKLAEKYPPNLTQKPKTQKESKESKTKENKTQKIVEQNRSKLSNDSTIVDSTAPRYFIGYHHVRIWSDSLQGVCDSISYSQRDSLMKMIGHPIAWSRESQITGDTILLYTDSSSVRKLFVPNNALLVSRSGPEKAQLYDQVQGKTMTGYFVKNKLEKMVVFPSAESIYYSKDDHGAYIGVVQAEGERMTVFFEESNIKKILIEQDPKQTLTPMNKANLPAMRLSQFKWLQEQRPKSKEELFQ